jgi:transcriptional regulator with XRE-family HTH domain
MARAVDPRFAQRMREILAERGLSYRALAARTFYAKSYLHELASGRKAPTAEVAARLDDALGAGGELAGHVAERAEELDALELAARIAASDVSAETLVRMERLADDLAVAYARVTPAQLLPQVRQHLAYVGQLLGARTTLDQRRRLLVIGGWLSLLAGTLQIDLRRRRAAHASLETSRQMADHAEHAELRAWCLETRAWDALVVGDFPTARDLSLQAQAAAPRGSSVHIRATAQEGRAWARMGRPAETRDALNRTARLVSPLPVPDRPEHHYRYDPGKALAYTATTLSWVGDAAAVDYARDVVAQMEADSDGVPRPRRAALARLDLSLALLGTGRPDEAGSVATAAITSGLLVPSTWWRATEVVGGVERAGVGEAGELRDAYESHRPGTRA